MKYIKMKYGFTLIELLVVVIIIAVLAAVAVPLYKRAVLKSRFSAVMPVAKKLANAQEVYYLGNGYYAEDGELLDVDFSEAEGVSVSLPDEQHYEQYNYVLASHNGVPNAHYIIYQNKSVNFAGERHCEASKTDTQALWLCSKGLNGTRVSGSLTPDYQTYVLEGEGNGVSYSIANTMAGIACEESENSGNKSCTVDRTSSTEYVIKTVCTDKTDPSTCTYHVYNKDAYHWECYASKSKLVDGVCVPTAQGAYAYRYDEDGNKVQLECDEYNTTQDACEQWATRTYNQLGTKVKADRRECAQWDSNGLCTQYKQNAGYDSFGTMSSNQGLFNNPGGNERGSLNFADSTTNWAQLNCAEVNSEGACISYKDGYFDTTVWDENKNGTFFERVNCSEVTPQGECATISTYQTIEATYTDSGKVESKEVVYRACLTQDAAGNCTSYTQDKNDNYQEYYTYNDNNKKLSYTRYRCNEVASATECSGPYATSYTQNYTYNSANKETSDIRVGCNAYNAKNECTEYDKAQTNTYKTYADNQTTQTSQITNKCNEYTGLICTGGWTVVTTPYVNGKADNNNKDINPNCSRVDMATGVCLDGNE